MRKKVCPGVAWCSIGESGLLVTGGCCCCCPCHTENSKGARFSGTVAALLAERKAAQSAEQSGAAGPSSSSVMATPAPAESSERAPAGESSSKEAPAEEKEEDEVLQFDAPDPAPKPTSVLKGGSIVSTCSV